MELAQPFHQCPDAGSDNAREREPGQVCRKEVSPCHPGHAEAQLCHEQEVDPEGRADAERHALYAPELPYEGAGEDADGEHRLAPGASVDRACCARDGIAKLVARAEQHAER